MDALTKAPPVTYWTFDLGDGRPWGVGTRDSALHGTGCDIACDLRYQEVMLPPVLEIFVVWHPFDDVGEIVARDLVEHFHGTVFTGLIGGAVDVYVRSEGAAGPGSVPLAIPMPGDPPLRGVSPAGYVAVVPVLGPELAREVEQPESPWLPYLRSFAGHRDAKVFPLLAMDRRSLGQLGQVFDGPQDLGSVFGWGETWATHWRRDLVQALTQFVSGSDAQLEVFISHTRQTVREVSSSVALTRLVRTVISDTRLGQFFDVNSLQSGEDWRRGLRENAARKPMLALRTDRYASRAWCQEEVTLAKTHGAPLVVLDALHAGEDRGSFLMDHVPRALVRHQGGDWSRQDVENGLAVLVDESLKRALWRAQQALAAGLPELAVDWWAPHAPEPVTLTAWLLGEGGSVAADGEEPLTILHPDPPLGRPEQQALDDLVRLRRLRRRLEIMTPRQLAARGR